MIDCTDEDIFVLFFEGFMCVVCTFGFFVEGDCVSDASMYQMRTQKEDAGSCFDTPTDCCVELPMPLSFLCLTSPDGARELHH